MKKIVKKVVTSVLFCSILLSVFTTVNAENISSDNSKNELAKELLSEYNNVMFDELCTMVNKDLKTGETKYIEPIKNNERENSEETSFEGYIPKKSRVIVDDDERELVSAPDKYPYSAICYIEANFSDGTYGKGTAFMIDKDTLLTAGHCIYDAKHGGFATGVVVIPGKFGDEQPFGFAISKSLATTVGYQETGDKIYDWGVIDVRTPIGDNTGWIGVRAYHEPSALMYKDVNIVGYPSKEYIFPLWQHEMSGKIYGATDPLIAYYIDTTNGQSGSPVYEIDSNNGNPYAIGIHTGGWDDGSFNRGTRVTNKMLDSLRPYVN